MRTLAVWILSGLLFSLHSFRCEGVTNADPSLDVHENAYPPIIFPPFQSSRNRRSGNSEQSTSGQQKAAPLAPFYAILRSERMVALSGDVGATVKPGDCFPILDEQGMYLTKINPNQIWYTLQVTPKVSFTMAWDRISIIKSSAEAEEKYGEAMARMLGEFKINVQKKSADDHARQVEDRLRAVVRMQMLEDAADRKAARDAQQQSDIQRMQSERQMGDIQRKQRELEQKQRDLEQKQQWSEQQKNMDKLNER